MTAKFDLRIRKIKGDGGMFHSDPTIGYMYDVGMEWLLLKDG